MPKPVHLIVLDTETGGLDPNQHSVIELAAIHMCLEYSSNGDVGSRSWAGNGTSVGTYSHFHSYVLPDRLVSEQAAIVNGYSPEKWEHVKARPMQEVGSQFLAWLDNIPLEDLTWAGSNVGFDLGFIAAHFARCEPKLVLPGAPKFGRRNLNTESLCFPLLVTGQVDSCGVAALRKWARCPGEQSHQALHDALGTVGIIGEYFKRRVWI